MDDLSPLLQLHNGSVYRKKKKGEVMSHLAIRAIDIFNIRPGHLVAMRSCVRTAQLRDLPRRLVNVDDVTRDNLHQ